MANSNSANQKQNERKITQSFNKFKADEFRIILQGVKDLAEFAMEMLEKHHRESEQVGGDSAAHITEENTMAYAVAHDGQVLAAGHNQGDGDAPTVSEAVGRAEEYAREFSSMESGPTSWVIVLFSQMEGWYKWNMEMNFYYATKYDIQKHFNDFFKPIK